MRKFKALFSLMLACWLLAIGIDGFYGGVMAGRAGAIVNLIGAAIGFLLLIASFFDRPPRERP